MHNEGKANKTQVKLIRAREDNHSEGKRPKEGKVKLDKTKRETKSNN